MATFSQWTPFGVALNITAVSATVTRTSATKFAVKINASWETYYSGAKTNYGMTASSGGGSVTLNAFGTKASSGSGSFTGTYDISGNDSAKKTITVTFRNFNNDNGDSATKTVSISVTVPAWTSYTVTYNANGGSGAPGKQTKWMGQSLVLSSTKPTRTGYTFQRWNTKADGSGTSYASGATYNGNAALTLYAVWSVNTYTVTYNANGGNGAPGNQTKKHGETLKLSSTIPTRTDYTFKGWGTSPTATTVSYTAGASYTNNAAITLYAIWELSYTKPRIKNLKVSRSNSSGGFQDDGTDIRVIFDYEIDKDEIPYVYWSFKASTETEWFDTLTAYDSNRDGHIAFGTYSDSESAGKIDLEKTYTWQLIVSDSGGSTTLTGTVSSLNLAIDVRPPDTFSEGDEAKFGVAVGKTAELRGVFDMGLKAKFREGYVAEKLETANGAGVDLNNITKPGWYVGANKATYSNAPKGLSGTFTLEVFNAGLDDNGEYIQLMQRITRCSSDPLEYVRHYFSNAWQPWIRKFGVSLYSNSSGSDGVITLKDYNDEGELVTADLSKFKSIEIYYTDNNGKSGGYTKIHSPQGKDIELHCIEAGSASNTYVRRTRYKLDGGTITPYTDTAAYIILYNNGLIGDHIKGQLIKIYKVIGYEYEM